MRSSPTRPCPPIFGPIGFALGLSFALAISTTAWAQDSPGSSTSMARSIPKDNLVLYCEYDGLDAHLDAWKKTAAYKILNETPTGEMIEKVVGQLLDRFGPPDSMAQPGRKGADQVALIKHLARSGFLVAKIANKEAPEKSPVVLVIRNGFKNKEIRPILGRTLLGMNANNTKPQTVIRSGQKVIGGTLANGKEFAWWAEESKQEDIVLVFPGVEAADLVVETLAGKHANATGHPRWVELGKPEADFKAVGRAFVEPVLFENSKNAEVIGLKGFSKLDFRWGFRDDALMTVTRLTTPSPRKGIPALLEGSTLDLAKLPPIPEKVDGFTAASFDLPSMVEPILGMAKGFQLDGTNPMGKAIESMKAKTKLRLKEDLLAHLGPKVAWYSLPGKGGASVSSPVGLFSPVGEVPRFALVSDVNDSKAFGSVLDQAMVELNREFKALVKPPGDAPAKGARAKVPSLPAPEFKVMPGETKMYVLSIPPELGVPLNPAIRPTIRVGPKHAVFAASPEVARLVLEAKGAWSPPKEMASAFEGLPSKWKMLGISDPRDTLPTLLASLPGRLQASLNTAMLMKTPPPSVAPPGGTPPPDPNADRGRKPVAANPGGGSGTGATAGAPGTGMPSGGQAPLTFQIDASRLPTAEAIKALLFPSMFTVESTDDTIQVVTRDAFLSVSDPAEMAVTLSLVLPAIQAMRAGKPIPAMAPTGGRIAPGSGPDRGKPGAAGKSGGGNNPQRPD